jgi:shikimate kinase
VTGLGRSGGAGTVVNAMATGNGIAFGLRFDVTAAVRPSEMTLVMSNGESLQEPEDQLVRECLALVEEEAQREEPLNVDITSPIPPRRGLKSSSAVAVAVLDAASQHFGIEPKDARLLDWAATAGIKSRTSRTGAYDDAAACRLGGLVFTDNAKRKILKQDRLPDHLVALIHLPEGETPSGRFLDADMRSLEEPVGRALKLARKGKIREAMLTNTLAYANVFDVDTTFTRRSLDMDAWAAGLSGTGPAQIALVAPDRAKAFSKEWGKLMKVELNHGEGA